MDRINVRNTAMAEAAALYGTGEGLDTETEHREWFDRFSGHVKAELARFEAVQARTAQAGAMSGWKRSHLGH